MRQAVVTLVLLLGWVGSAAAEKRAVRVVWLPTRAHTSAAQTEAQAIANDLARAAGGELSSQVESPEREAMTVGLARAAKLAGEGSVDEAADAFDAAIQRGRRALLELGDAEGLERGVVARIGIALARGEAARARELATWLLRVDPTFALDAAENGPRLAAELAAARGDAGALTVADLGDCRPSTALIVVVRITRPDQLELHRLNGCQLRDAEVVTIGGDHRAAVRAIVGIDTVETAPSRPSGSTPVYRKTWFWVAVGAVAVGAAGTVYFVDRKETLEVVPHW